MFDITKGALMTYRFIVELFQYCQRFLVVLHIAKQGPFEERFSSLAVINSTSFSNKVFRSNTFT